MLHDPGGTRTALPAGVEATAIYGGPNNEYRYRLNWTWDASLPVLMALMMNPSCASEQCGDRTVSWVYRWAKARGYGKLIVVNSMAYRAADQVRLAEVDDPCRPENAHLSPREKPRRSGRGGKRERPSGASLWDLTYSAMIASGAPPHDPTK